MSTTFHDRVIAAIRTVPTGRVATYGQIAGIAGSPRAAIIVGEILRRNSRTHDLPWQRIINRHGELSIVNIEYPAELQAELLRSEGVEVVKENGIFRVNLAQFQWKGA